MNGKTVVAWLQIRVGVGEVDPATRPWHCYWEMFGSVKVMIRFSSNFAPLTSGLGPGVKLSSRWALFFIVWLDCSKKHGNGKRGSWFRLKWVLDVRKCSFGELKHLAGVFASTGSDYGARD